MKKQIIITEEDGEIKIEKFLSDSKGKLNKVDQFEDIMEMHWIIHRAVHQDKREIIDKKIKAKGK